MSLPPKPSPRRRRRSKTAGGPTRRPGLPVDALEPRRLLAAVSLASREAIVQPFPNLLSTSAAQPIHLANFITDPNVPGTVATFVTNRGSIVVALTDSTTPLTVANFLSYVNSGAYNNTVIDQSRFYAGNAGNGSGGSAANPANYFAGGGYTVSPMPGPSTLNHITTTAFVTDEFNNAGALQNLQGTLAVLNGGTADSGSSDWFFNNTDNTALFSGAIPTRQLHPTVFGHVLSGMNVLTDIASLPTAALNQAGFPTVPVTGLTPSQIAAQFPIGPSSLVYTSAIQTTLDNTYTVTSNDPALVNPSVVNGVLSFKYATDATGTAVVTVTGNNSYDGTTATATFAVTVPPASSPPPGPAPVADAVTNTVGLPTVFHPLANDADGTSALNATTVHIATPPAHGTATVDPTSGDITYSDLSGFTGTDTLTYTVADSAGTVSAPATVTVTVVAAPVTVTIGGAAARSLSYVQPSGAAARLTITGGTAAVTFSAGTLTPTVRNGVETVTGTGATISNVVVTNQGRLLPTVTLTALGSGTLTLGGLTDAGGLSAVIAPAATLTGTLSVTGVRRLTLAAASHANLSLGGASGAATVQIGTANDTSLNAFNLASVTAGQWTVDDGGAYQLLANAITKLTVAGAFAEPLSVAGATGFALDTVMVGAASGVWAVNGSIRRATLASATSTFSVTAGGTIQSLAVRGNMSGTVSAATIGTLTVAGDLTNATVQTSAPFNTRALQITRLSVAGAVTGSVIFAAGNLGAISAASFSGSRVYAGVRSAVAQARGLPTSTSDLVIEARIGSVRTSSFAGSEVAAFALGPVALGTTAVVSGGTPFGLSAHSIASVNATLNPGGRLALGPAALRSAAVLTSFLTTHNLVLENFAIDLYNA